MDHHLNVAALRLQGDAVLTWDDTTQTQSLSTQWLYCAGYVVAEDSATINIDVQDPAKQAIVYIKNNALRHANLGVRAFGVDGSARGSPLLDIKGRHLTRTWSLLAKTLNVGETMLQLKHDAMMMGWRFGDRIAVSATKNVVRGAAQAFTIVAFHQDNVLQLSHEAAVDTFKSEAVFTHDSEAPALLAAEVINLSRTVLITGDDFELTQGAVCPRGNIPIAIAIPVPILIPISIPIPRLL